MNNTETPVRSVGRPKASPEDDLSLAEDICDASAAPRRLRSSCRHRHPLPSRDAVVQVVEALQVHAGEVSRMAESGMQAVHEMMMER